VATYPEAAGDNLHRGPGTITYLEGLSQIWFGGIFIWVRSVYMWLKGRGGRRKLSECRLNRMDSIAQEKGSIW